jgi:hypothetical protein
MRTARTLEEEWKQVLWESVCTVPKADETSNVRVCVAEFHHIVALSRLGRDSKLTNRLLL